MELKTMSYPDFTHDGHCKATDPINLIFRKLSGDLSTQEIERLLESDGWGAPWFAWTHHLHPTQNGKCDQKFQKVLGSLFSRSHIRLWEWNGEAVANAHEETLSIGLGTHVRIKHEPAEEYVGDVFEQGGWTVKRNSQALNNFKSHPRNDGKATVNENSRFMSDAPFSSP